MGFSLGTLHNLWSETMGAPNTLIKNQLSALLSCCYGNYYYEETENKKAKFDTSKGTTCISMAKLVRWLHKHTEYVMFPSERTQPSLDHIPSFELKKRSQLDPTYRKVHMRDNP